VLWLDDRDNYFAFRYGEEGVHFERDGISGRIILNPDNYLMRTGAFFTNHSHDRFVYDPGLYESYPRGYQRELGELMPFVSPFAMPRAMQARNALMNRERPGGGRPGVYQVDPEYHIDLRSRTLASELYATLLDIHFGDVTHPQDIREAFHALRDRAEELGVAGVVSGIANEALGRR
jgi:hypothetical protein